MHNNIRPLRRLLRGEGNAITVRHIIAVAVGNLQREWKTAMRRFLNLCDVHGGNVTPPRCFVNTLADREKRRELGFAPFLFSITNGSMVSVVTVSWNARDTIADCLAFVTTQSVRPEHVLVDGASTDGTLEWLRSWTGHRLEIMSEPDQGIYDAMNKGLARASGEIVGILNADDWYAWDRVLEQVQEAMSDTSVDARYGDLVYVTAEIGGRRMEDRRQKTEDRGRQNFVWNFV